MHGDLLSLLSGHQGGLCVLTLAWKVSIFLMIVNVSPCPSNVVVVAWRIPRDPLRFDGEGDTAVLTELSPVLGRLQCFCPMGSSMLISSTGSVLTCVALAFHSASCFTANIVFGMRTPFPKDKLQGGSGAWDFKCVATAAGCANRLCDFAIFVCATKHESPHPHY